MVEAANTAIGASRPPTSFQFAILPVKISLTCCLLSADTGLSLWSIIATPSRAIVKRKKVFLRVRQRARSHTDIGLACAGVGEPTSRSTRQHLDLDVGMQRVESLSDLRHQRRHGGGAREQEFPRQIGRWPRSGDRCLFCSGAKRKH